MGYSITDKMIQKVLEFDVYNWRYLQLTYDTFFFFNTKNGFLNHPITKNFDRIFDFSGSFYHGNDDRMSLVQNAVS